MKKHEVLRGMFEKDRAVGRRGFLTQVSGAAASGLVLDSTGRATESPQPAPTLLPTIQLGSHRITRLAAGYNPIGGYSYLGRHMDRHMREYFTTERTIEFLERCEHAGINAHQYDCTEKMTQVLRTMRERGSKMRFICLHADRPNAPPIKKVIKTTKPIAIVHHGGVTDALFREGKSGQVHDYVKKVHDHGILAGVSAHNPDNVKRMTDEGWENDFFMTCFYNLTRPEDEQRKLMGDVLAVKPFCASDRDAMTRVVRQLDKPCLAFKILGAGRHCRNNRTVADAFQFAFANIKPTDGVIVGMYPRFHDEIADNADHARRFGARSVS